MSAQRITRSEQIKVYLGKCFRLFETEKQWKNFVSAFIIMILLCLVTGEDMFVMFADTKNGVFAIACACIWVGLFNSIQSVCRERNIIKREHRTGLDISAYIMAHVIYEMFISFVESLIILIMMLIKNHDHLPPEGLILGKVPDMFITLFLITFCADMLALLISCIVKTETSAMTVMPFVLIIQLVMSGAVFELEGISKAISYLTISRWGMNGMLSIANTEIMVEMEGSYMGMEGCDPTAGNLLTIWAVLILFTVIYIVAAIIALGRVDNDER